MSNLNRTITYNLGVVAYRKGNYDEALRKFKLAFSQNKKDFDTTYNIANCYFKKDRHYEAIKWYLMARALKPFDRKNLFNLALSYIKVRRFEKASKTLFALKALRKTDAKVYYLSGSLNLYKGDFRRAISDYRKGVEVQSSASIFEREGYKMLFFLHTLKREYALAENYANLIKQYYRRDAFFNYNLAYVYKNLGNFTDAISYYKKAITINPKFKEAYINYLHILNLEQRWDDVTKISDTAIKAFPREFYFYVTKAISLYRKNKYNQCAKVMKDALDINDTSVGASEFLAHLELRNGKLSDAIKLYEKVLTYKPSKVAVLINLAYLYARTNDLVKGVLTLQLGLHNGADKLTYRYLGQLYLKAGDTNNARQCYDIYLKQYPRGDYVTFYNIARIHHEKHKTDEAIKYYIKSIKLNYLFFNSHFNLAILYEKKEMFSKAVSHYLLCTNIYPNNYKSFYRIFVVYHNQGEFNIGVEYLEKAIKSGFKAPKTLKKLSNYIPLSQNNKFKKIMKKYFPSFRI